MSEKPDEKTETTAAPRPAWMKLLGLRRRKGRLLRLWPTKWGWLLIFVVVMIGGGGYFAHYSMQPEFCRSCHIMEPYFQAWHTSTHKNVPCADCHFEPGLKNTLHGKFQASAQAVKYITKTYGSKPHAEIQDASCMREGCHSERLLKGKVNWKVQTQRGDEITIRFDHTPHLGQLRRGKQLRCTSCHSQIVQGQHLVVTLDTCYTCHMKDVKHGRNDQTLAGCKSCHEAPKQQIRLATGMFNHADYTQKRGVTCENCHSEVVAGNGSVSTHECWKCHNQANQIARISDPGFMHKTHVTDHKVECVNCHEPIRHGLAAALPKGKGVRPNNHLASDSGTCGQCHEQTHGGPESLYRGTGGRGVPDMPSPMSRAQVDCIACHQDFARASEVAEVVGQTYKADQNRCDYCHGNQYKGMLDEWRKTIKQKLDQAEAAYLVAEKAVKNATAGAEQQLAAKRLLDDAIHNIRLVKFGHGVHNVNYSTALLSVAAENCRKAQTLASGGVASRGGQ